MSATLVDVKADPSQVPINFSEDLEKVYDAILIGKGKSAIALKFIYNGDEETLRGQLKGTLQSIEVYALKRRTSPLVRFDAIWSLADEQLTVTAVVRRLHKLTDKDAKEIVERFRVCVLPMGKLSIAVVGCSRLLRDDNLEEDRPGRFSRVFDELANANQYAEVEKERLGTRCAKRSSSLLAKREQINSLRFENLHSTIGSRQTNIKWDLPAIDLYARDMISAGKAGTEFGKNIRQCLKGKLPKKTYAQFEDRAFDNFNPSNQEHQRDAFRIMASRSTSMSLNVFLKLHAIVKSSFEEQNNPDQFAEPQVDGQLAVLQKQAMEESQGLVQDHPDASGEEQAGSRLADEPPLDNLVARGSEQRHAEPTEPSGRNESQTLTNANQQPQPNDCESISVEDQQSADSTHDINIKTGQRIDKSRQFPKPTVQGKAGLSDGRNDDRRSKTCDQKRKQGGQARRSNGSKSQARAKKNK